MEYWTPGRSLLVIALIPIQSTFFLVSDSLASQTTCHRVAPRAWEGCAEHGGRWARKPGSHPSLSVELGSSDRPCSAQSSAASPALPLCVRPYTMLEPDQLLHFCMIWPPGCLPLQSHCLCPIRADPESCYTQLRPGVWGLSVPSAFIWWMKELWSGFQRLQQGPQLSAHIFSQVPNLSF